MKTLFKILKNQNGFTLVDLLMSLGVGSITILAVVYLEQYSKKEVRRVSEQVENKVERLGAERMLAFDLSRATASLNYIDNNGFFDFDHNDTCLSNCARKLTLDFSQGDTSSKFFLIRSDAQSGDTFKLMPQDVAASGAYIAMNSTGSGINGTGGRFTQNSNQISWKAGQLMMMETISAFSDTYRTVPGVSSFKRKIIYAGLVNSGGTDLSSISMPSGMTIFNRYKLLETASATIIDSPNNYFTNLPYIPGLDALVVLYPATIVSYHLEKRNGKGVLIRTRYLPQGTSFVPASVVIASGVQYLVFNRDKLSSAAISYNIALDAVR